MEIRFIKVFLLLCLCCFAYLAGAQNITRAEYYVDTDPGPGQGTAVSVSSASEVEINFNFSTAGLPSGNHSVFLRTMDDTGLWSLYKKQTIYVQDNVVIQPFTEPRRLVAAEYFIDEDPGVGNGRAIPINKSQDAMAKFTISSSGLELGAHTAYIRIQDSRGLWSLAGKKQFGVLPSDTKYPIPFFSADTVSAGASTTFENLSDSVDANTTYAWDIFDDGSVDYTTESITHVFDSSGIFPVRLTATNDSSAYYIGKVVVGDFDNRQITVNGSTELCEGETVELSAPAGYTYEWNTGETTQSITVEEAGNYFVFLTDADELSIKSNSVSIAVTPSFSATVSVQPATSGLSNGFAEVHASVEKGTELQYSWSNGGSGTYISDLSPGSYSVTVSSGACSQEIQFTIGQTTSTGSTEIVQAEYFWDTDPGVGNGTSVNTSRGTSITFADEISVDGLSVGNHQLYVRSRSNTGLWSFAKAFDVFVQDPTVEQGTEVDLNIVAAEYFVDADPGVGNGTSISVSGSVKELAGSIVLNEADYSAGEHILHIRTKADNGLWSTYATQAFQVCGLLPDAPTVSDVQHCAGASLSLTAVGTTGNTFHWYTADSVAIDGQTTASFNAGQISTDTTFYVAQVDAGGCQSQLSEINVQVEEIEVFAGIEETISLAGDTYVLDAFFPSAGVWSGTGISANGEIDRNSLNASEYTYTYTIDGGNCQFTDTKKITVLDLSSEVPITMDEDPEAGSLLTTLDFEDPIVEYSIVNGIDTALTINANGEVLIASPAVFDFEENNTLSFTINGKVNDRITDQSVISITLINTPDAPIVEDQLFTLDENSGNGTVIGDIIASDPDSPTIAFSITSGNDSGTFGIQNTNQLFVVDSTALDFETQTSFVLGVDVTDGVLTSSATITIELNDLEENEAPQIADQNFSIAENSQNGTIVGTITASDPDDDALSYSIAAGNDEGVFEINANSGELSVVDSTLLDFEINPSFSLTVEVSDGTEQASAIITVSLTDVQENQAPQIADQNFTIAENTAIGTVVGAISASDPEEDLLTYSITSGNEEGAFALDATSGTLSVADVTLLDFETNPSFSLTVEVSDGEFEANAVVTIALTDVDESQNQIPQIADQNFSIAENSPNGTVVGNIFAFDPDDDVLTYSISNGNENGAFALNNTTGDLTVSNVGLLDFETTPEFVLTVEVSDEMEVSSAVITVMLTDVDESQNQAPTAITLSNNAIEEENTVGDLIGSFSTTDPDATDTHSYSFVEGTGDLDNNSFSLAGSDLQAAVVFDFETKSSYSIRLQTSDGNGGIFEEIFTISILDITEKSEQTITIEPIEDQFNTMESVEIVASTTSGLSLSYSLQSGPANISGNVINLTGELGEVVVEVSQAGNSEFLAASETVSFMVIEDPCQGFSASANSEAVSCAGAEDGTIVIQTTEGTAPFSYSLAGGQTIESNSFTDLAAGEYTIVVTDANGCTASITAVVESPEPLEVTADVVDSNSINGNGSISLSVTGGSGNYSYSWSNGASGANLSELEIGEYTVTITDDAGCNLTASYSVGGVTATSQAFEVDMYPNPVIHNLQIIHGEKVDQISIIDASGKTIMQRETTGKQSHLDMSMLPAGLYFIRLDNGILNRIIKQ